MQRIGDPDDPRLADYRHLTDAAARRAVEHSPDAQGAHGIFIVEGLLALRQLLVSPYRVRSLLVSQQRADAALDELGRADPTGSPPPFPVLVGTAELLHRVTGFDVHRGVLAAANRRPPTDPDELLRVGRRIVVVDGVNDNENLGSIFRNAAALGIDAVLLDDRAADPLYRRTIRVSAGWSMRVPNARIGPSEHIPAVLRRHGITSVALTPDPTAITVQRAVRDGLLDDPVALIVGAEGPGLSLQVLDAVDHRVRIPMRAGVDSLNVATSLAVVAAFLDSGVADRGEQGHHLERGLG